MWPGPIFIQAALYGVLIISTISFFGGGRAFYIS